jgi:hypothetical protein
MYDRTATPGFPTVHDVGSEMARLHTFLRVIGLMSFADHHRLSDCARVTGKPEVIHMPALINVIGKVVSLSGNEQSRILNIRTRKTFSFTKTN